MWFLFVVVVYLPKTDSLSYENYLEILRRDACGCNDHPDATTFLQVFRLLGTYSLIKPPRGSNVTGDEMVRSLLDYKDLTHADNDRHEFSSRLECLLITQSITSTDENSTDHSYYFQQNSPDSMVGFMAGFVAFRGQTMSKWIDCKNSLLPSNDENINPNAYELIHVKARHSLTKPSANLFSLITVAENSIMKVVAGNKLHMNTLADIINNLEQVSNLPLVGCFQHQLAFTKKLLNYYLILRMIFICRRENLIDNFKNDQSFKLIFYELHV